MYFQQYHHPDQILLSPAFQRYQQEQMQLQQGNQQSPLQSQGLTQSPQQSQGLTPSTQQQPGLTPPLQQQQIITLPPPIPNTTTLPSINPPPLLTTTAFHHLPNQMRRMNFYDSSAQSSRASSPEPFRRQAYTTPSSRIHSPLHSDQEDDDHDLDLSTLPKNEPLFLNFSQDVSPSGELRGLILHPGSSITVKSATKPNSGSVYKPLGVNLLNRNSIDSKTALDRLKKRRENHNFVERRRRDNINNTIYQISQLLPQNFIQNLSPKSSMTHNNTLKPNKGVILKICVEYLSQNNLHLQHLNNRILQLEETLKNHHIQIPDPPSPPQFGNVIGNSTFSFGSLDINSNFTSPANSLPTSPIMTPTQP